MSELGIGTIKEEVESEEDTTEGVIYEEDGLVSAKSNDDASDIKASVVEVSSNGEIDHEPGVQSILGKPFNCYHCNFSCRTRICLKKHVAGHVGDVFGNTRSSKGEKPLVCNLCDYRSLHAGNLRRHKKVHSDDKPYSCDVCGFKTKKPYSLKMHMITHTGQRLLACDQCDYTCNRPQHLKRHMVAHSGEKPFACSICPYRGTDLMYLVAHMKIHADKLYACDKCDYKAVAAWDVKRHAKIHDVKRPLSPESLDYGVLQDAREGVSSDPERGLNVQDPKLRARNRRNRKPYVCYHCDNRARTRGDMKIHLRTHTGEKPHACSLCNYKSTQLGHLRRHMTVHTGEKPYACDMCGYRTQYLASLKTHKMIHTKEKPYACSECQYRTTTLGSLKLHMRTHTGEKPFVCPVCGFRTKQGGHIKLHMRTHTGEKPYKCDLCDYKSARLYHLKVHLMKHSGQKPNACEKCDFRGSTVGEFKRHMMTHEDDSGSEEEVAIEGQTIIKVEPMGDELERDSSATTDNPREEWSVNESNEPSGFLQNSTSDPSALEMHQKCPEIGQETADNSNACGRLSGEPHHRVKSSVDESNRAAGFLQSCTAEQSVPGMHQKCPEIGQETAGTSIICGRLSGEPHHRMKSSVDESNRAAGFLQSCTADPRVLGMHQKCPEIGQETAGNSIICGRLSGEPHHRVKSSVDESNRAAGFSQNSTSDPSVLEMHQKCPEIGQETAENSTTCGGLSGEPHHRVKSSVDESNRAAGFSQNSTSDPSVLEMHQKCPEIGQKTAENATTCGGLSGEVRHRVESSFHESSQAAVLMQNCMSESSVLELHLNCPEIGESSASNSIIGESSVAHHRMKMESSGDESNQGLLNGIAEPIPQLFECHQCEFRGKTHIGLKRHMKMHVGETSDRSNNAETPRKLYIGDMYVCDLCDFRTKQLRLLTVHMRVHTGEKPYACDQCNFRTAQLGSLKTHKRRHTGEKPFACDQCDKRFSQRDHLRRHIMAHTGEKPFSCDVCDHRSAALSDLKRHMMTHSGEKPYACDCCDYRSANMEGLRVHVRTHTGERPFACTMCDYRGKASGDVKRHMKTHLNQLVIKEEVVNEQSSAPLTVPGDSPQLTSLLPEGRHLKLPDKLLKSPRIRMPFFCYHCGYRGRTKRNLKVHMSTHTGDMPFSCDQCSFTSNRLENFKRHVRTHTGERPYACDLCDYRTTTNGCLKVHMRKHTGEKPFACSFCPYRAAASRDLKRHVRTHTGEKPYACDICDYRAAELRNLKEHKRFHTGVRPYACHSCDYKAFVSGDLKRHVLRHHSKEMPAAHDSLVCEIEGAESEQELTIGDQIIIKEEAMTIDDVNNPNLEASLTDDPLSTPGMSGDQIMASSRDVLEPSVYKPPEAYQSIEAGQLKELMWSHAEGKSFSCDLTDYQEANLGFQSMIHEKPDICDYGGPSRDLNFQGGKPNSCGSREYEVSTVKSLTRHVKSHSGEKVFACSDCDYKVGSTRDLKIHMRTHTGERPYACNICDYKSRTSSGLNRHLKTHSVEKHYSCSLCDYRCRAQSALRKHTVRVHNG